MKIRMAQVDLIVSIDSQKQKQIDQYCNLLGLSRKVAFDEMIKMWERLVYLPQMDFIEKESNRRKAREAFFAIRERAEKGETPDLSMDEIIEEIALARKEKYNTEVVK